MSKFFAIIYAFIPFSYGFTSGKSSAISKSFTRFPFLSQYFEIAFCYVSRRITDEMKAKGYIINHKTVLKLMKSIILIRAK